MTDDLGATVARRAAIRRAQRIVENAMPDFVDEATTDAVVVARALLAREQAVAGWQPIETAPRDGTAFLSVDPRFGVVQLTVRRVRFVADLGGYGVCTVDMGAWLYVSGIDDDFAEQDTDGSIRWAVAPDEHNRSTPRLWRPLPAPPGQPVEGER